MSINNLCSEVFEAKFPEELRLLIAVLQENGKQIYIVGGAVRDFILDYPFKEYDLATNATPQELMKILNQVDVKIKPIGGIYGTILAIINKRAFDISTFRREIFKIPGEPPEVEFVSSLEEDLQRRDFRINAIAFDPLQHVFIDFVKGLTDINERTIRIIGHPSRLEDDGLRIVRLARFSSQLNFQIHSSLVETTKKIGENAKFRKRRSLKLEFFKLLKLPDPTRGFTFLFHTKVLQSILPNLQLLSENQINSEFLWTNLKEIPQNDVLIRLFLIGEILVNAKTSLERKLESYITDLALTNKEQNYLNRISSSWLNFPMKPDTFDLKKWVRQTGINTSESLFRAKVIFSSHARDEIFLEHKDIYSLEIKKVLKRLRK